MPTDPYLCAGCERPSPACTCVQNDRCGTCGTDLGAAADLQRELEAENARLRERIATVERARHAHGVWAAHANGKAQPADVLFSALGDAIDETNQLRTRLATVERETADARRLGASIVKAQARAVEHERAAVVRAAEDLISRYLAKHGGGGDYCAGVGDLREIVAAGAHRTDDPLPSALAAAREEGRVDGLREAVDWIKAAHAAHAATLTRGDAAKETK